MNRIEQNIIEKAQTHFIEYAEEWDWHYDNYMNNGYDTFEDFIEMGIDYAIGEAISEETRLWTCHTMRRFVASDLERYFPIEVLRENLIGLLDGLNDNERFLYEQGDIDKFEPYELEGVNKI